MTVDNYSFLYSFSHLDPSDIKKELREVTFNWWICGGWALELFAQSKIREHHDMDIAVLRKDQFKLREQLPDWEFKIAINKILHDWGEHAIDGSSHALWARKKGQEKWTTEFLLNEASESNWIFRKNDTITHPLNEISFVTNSIPVLKPIIPLLFKSAHCDKKDNLDFLSTVNKIHLADRQLLRDWIKIFQPNCIWLDKL